MINDTRCVIKLQDILQIIQDDLRFLLSQNFQMRMDKYNCGIREIE